MRRVPTSQLAAVATHSGTCDLCYTRRFLRPLDLVFPGGAFRLHACLECRLNWRDNEWGVLLSSMLHAPAAEARAWAAQGARELEDVTRGRLQSKSIIEPL